MGPGLAFSGSGSRRVPVMRWVLQRVSGEAPVESEPGGAVAGAQDGSAAWRGAVRLQVHTGILGGPEIVIGQRDLAEDRGVGIATAPCLYSQAECTASAIQEGDSHGQA